MPPPASGGKNLGPTGLVGEAVLNGRDLRGKGHTEQTHTPATSIPPAASPRPPFTQGGHRCYLSLPCVRGGQSRPRRDRRGRRGRSVRLSPQNDTRPVHGRSRQQTGGVVLPGICGLGPSQREAPSEPPTGWAAGDGFVTLRGSHKFTTLWAGVLSYRPVTVRGCKNRKNRKRKIPHRSRKKR